MEDKSTRRVNRSDCEGPYVVSNAVCCLLERRNPNNREKLQGDNKMEERRVSNDRDNGCCTKMQRSSTNGAEIDLRMDSTWDVLLASKVFGCWSGIL